MTTITLLAIPSYKAIIEGANNSGIFDVNGILSMIDKDFKVEYPKKPSQPFLKTSHSIEDVKKYASDLDAYEKAKVQYDIDKSEIQKYQKELNTIKEHVIKEHSGLYSNVPKQYQEKVYSKAWESGHAYGYYEVYNHLVNLIEIFE